MYTNSSTETPSESVDVDGRCLEKSLQRQGGAGARTRAHFSRPWTTARSFDAGSVKTWVHLPKVARSCN